MGLNPGPPEAPFSSSLASFDSALAEFCSATLDQLEKKVGSDVATMACFQVLRLLHCQCKEFIKRAEVYQQKKLVKNAHFFSQKKSIKRANLQNFNQKNRLFKKKFKTSSLNYF